MKTRWAAIPLALMISLTSCDPQKRDAPAEPSRNEGRRVAPGPGVRDAAKTSGSSAAAPAAATGEGAPVAAPTKRRVVLPSGLAYEVLKPGTGAHPKLGSTVSYHWTGWLANGREFGDSRRTGTPQSDVLTHMDLISGLVEALLDMKVGERRVLHIPSRLAYGDEGYRFVVPPGADVRMDVELLGTGS